MNNLSRTASLIEEPSLDQGNDYKGAVAKLKLNGSEHKGLLLQWMCSLARKLVLSQLEGIGQGLLIINENGQRHSFGDASSDLIGEINIHDISAFKDIMTGGSIGAAESYMTGDWTTPDLTQLIRVMVKNIDLVDGMEGGLAKLGAPILKWFHSLNENTEKGSRRNKKG